MESFFVKLLLLLLLLLLIYYFFIDCFCILGGLLLTSHSTECAQLFRLVGDSFWNLQLQSQCQVQTLDKSGDQKKKHVELLRSQLRLTVSVYECGRRSEPLKKTFQVCRYLILFCSLELWLIETLAVQHLCVYFAAVLLLVFGASFFYIFMWCFSFRINFFTSRTGSFWWKVQ